jgi:hypothetical protein
MKYGIYEEASEAAILHSTTVRLDIAKLRAYDESAREGCSYIVVELGPQTPDRIEYFDNFAPRVLFRTERL